ncbi:MAG TPA: DUF3386 family protein, partial [Gemmataceae bacterium]|nr:DUF3386 family protein [Gemmataceae bacterium]
MKRCWTVSLLLLVCAAPARAHFVWIVPEKETAALVIFSDSLQPDSDVPIAKIAQTELFARDTDNKTTTLKAMAAKDAYRVVAPAKGASLIGGVCRYGVIQRGKAEPFLLVYHAKTIVGNPPSGGWQPWDRLALQIIPVEGISRARVLWQGKPLRDAEVIVRAPGQDKEVERRTNEEGIVSLDKATAAGIYGIRARHSEMKAGEEGGKKYKEVRHYATLTFRVAAPGAIPGGGAPARGGKAPAQTADPAATKLLRDARAARANWEKFPGFSADLEYNHGGKVVKGRIDVSSEGRVKVDLPDAAARAWAQRQMQSIVDHRLDSSADRDTPCAFLDSNATHPLGRAIKVLNDELHSSYRIRGLEIIEVNRQMKGGRFTITVLENRLTPEKKYLPTSYV